MFHPIRLKGHAYKNFCVTQAEPRPAKRGVGPYALYFNERERSCAAADMLTAAPSSTKW